MDSTDLLNSIKVRAAVPLAQISFTDQDLLNFASEEIDLKIVPSVLSVREEFYVTTETIPLVSGQSSYKIPYRAIGGKIRFVYIQSTDNTIKPLAQIAMERMPEFQESSFAYQNTGFYIQSDEIVLLPPISGPVSGSLIVKYYLKPNAVVEASRGAQITAIDTSTGNIAVDGVPSNITAGSLVDFIQSISNHKTRAFDVQVVSANSTTKIINVAPSSIPADLVVGDYICTAGEAIVAQVPSELQVMVAQAVACRVLEAIGDTQGLANATSKLQEMEVKLLNVIDSRVESPSKKLVNTQSFINNNRRIRRWGR